MRLFKSYRQPLLTTFYLAPRQTPHPLSFHCWRRRFYPQCSKPVANPHPILHRQFYYQLTSFDAAERTFQNNSFCKVSAIAAGEVVFLTSPMAASINWVSHRSRRDAWSPISRANCVTPLGLPRDFNMVLPLYYHLRLMPRHISLTYSFRHRRFLFASLASKRPSPIHLWSLCASGYLHPCLLWQERRQMQLPWTYCTSESTGPLDMTMFAQFLYLQLAFLIWL